MKSLNKKTSETTFCIVLLFLLTYFVLKYIENSTLFLIITALIILILFIYIYYIELFYKLENIIFKYRWLIFTFLLLLLSILRVSGSSIGAFDEIFTTQLIEKDTTIFGAPRWIRSDEYGLSTLKYFTQKYNNFALYSNQFSISDENMMLDFYSPTLSLSIIGKPFIWGYLILTNAFGLSLNWLMIEGLLFMMAFEMFLIITKSNKIESLIGAMLISLAPANQWWILPHVSILVVYIMSLFVIGYYFFVSKNVFAKIFTCICAVILIVGYAISLFPAFQVGLLYIVFPLYLLILYRDKDFIKINKIDIFRIIVVLVLSTVIFSCCVYESFDDIKILMNTVYPGERMCLGKTGTIKELFYNLSNSYIPYKDITYSNNCEVSSYFHFGPLCLLLSIKVLPFLRKKNKADYYICLCQFLVIVLFLIYMFFGFSETLAKITLFRYLNRYRLVYEFACVIFSVWMLNVINTYDVLNRIEKKIYPILFTLIYILTIDNNLIEYFKSFDLRIFNIDLWYVFVIFELLIILLITYLYVNNKQKLLLYVILLFMLNNGAIVNPIEIGTSPIYNHPISEKITNMVEEDRDSIMLCVDCPFYISNFIAANGIKTLSASNFNPDFEKFEIIDHDKKYEDIYNRYSNQQYFLIDDDNYFELMNGDSIYVYINPETLKNMNVNYILCNNNYDELLIKYDIYTEMIFEQDGYFIYKLFY